MKWRHRIALAVYASSMAFLSMAAPWVWRWRSRREPLYADRARATHEPPGWRGEAPDVWLHAVSVGEFMAVRPLLEHWLRCGLGIVLTTTTPSGARYACEWLERLRGAQPDARMVHAYFPIDQRRTWARWLTTLRPRRIVVVETEIWPLLSRVAQQTATPVYVLNGRLSRRSARRYARLAWLFRPVWTSLSGVFARSPWDARRFRALGVPRARIHLCGDIKTVLIQTAAIGGERADAAIGRDAAGDQQAEGSPPDHLDAFPWTERLRARWSSAPVLVVASTHEGEEDLLAPVLRAVWEAQPSLVVVIAPRHPHRCDSVQSMFEAHGWTVTRWSMLKQRLLSGVSVDCGSDTKAAARDSRPALLTAKSRGSGSGGHVDEAAGATRPPAERNDPFSIDETSQVESAGPLRRSLWLIDTLGDLATLQAMADCVWLGGSWVPVGGHNPMEALRAGVPVVTGPYVHNFGWWMHRLSHRGWVLKASVDSRHLADRTIDYLREDSRIKAARKAEFALECPSLVAYKSCVERVW